MTRWDGPAARSVAAHRTASLVRLAKAVTVLGSPAFTIAVTLAVAAGLLWWGQRRAAAGWLTAMVLTGDLLYVVVKDLVRRPRPPGGLVHATTFSFPSGHAMAAVTLFGGLAWILSRQAVPLWLKAVAWAGAALLVVAVAATRLELRVHYASDLIGGAALGAAWLAAWATLWVTRGLDRRGSIHSIRGA